MAELIKDKDGDVTGLMSTWNREDIISCFEDEFDQEPLTKYEIDFIIRSLVDSFDAEYGICWASIRTEIAYILELRED